MKNKLTRFHIFTAFLIHIVVIAAFSFFEGITTIHNKFIVLGVHSRKPSRALYQPRNKPVPFVGDRSSFERRCKQIKEKKQHLLQEKRRKEKLARQEREKRRRLQEKIRKEKQAKRELEKKKKQAQKLAQQRKRQNKKKKVQVKKVHKKPLAKRPKTSLAKLKKKSEKVKAKPVVKKKLHAKKEQIQEEILNHKKPTKQVEKEEEIKKREQFVERKDEKKIKEIEEELKELDSKLEPEEELQFCLDYVSNERLRKYQSCVQKEVQRLWRPPVGVPKSTECQVNFVVNKYGKVARFEILKSSCVLIYDLSISRIAKKFAFDQCLWGKRFTINFRQ